MRILLACAAVLSVGLLAGCGDTRESVMVVPDRDGHAASPTDAQPATGGSTKQVAGPNEMWITLGNGDTLTSVSKAYGVTVEWLIKRNKLSGMPKPGDNLIVPKQR